MTKPINRPPRKSGPKEKPIDVREVRRLASRGLTQKQIAGCLGISETKFFEHKARKPELAAAVDQGLSTGISIVANALFEKAKKGDTQAATFFLKARAGWKDRYEFSGDSENPIRHVITSRVMTAEEWEKEYGEKKEFS